MDGDGDYLIQEVEPSTVPCKHGYRDCVTCGTSDRRDRPHTTRDGTGCVAALRRCGRRHPG